MNSAQRNYSVTERECLAAVEAITKLLHYIELHEFEVITDHASLVWLMRHQKLSGRFSQWSLYLQGLNFTILQLVHREWRVRQ